MDNPKNINHLSLCSGYEGIGLGLKYLLPNLREIAYVEIEAYAVANLVTKMEEGSLDSAPIWTNVKDFPYRKFRGLVDILSGGFPCQPFSHAGARKSTEDPRHLFPSILRGIEECQPKIIFLENVEGILTAKTSEGEPVLKYVLGSLESLGYRATAGLFSASEIGAPHQRKRVFILGCDEGWNMDYSLRRRYLNTNEKICAGRIGSFDASELANSDNEGLEGRYGRGLSERRGELSFGESNSSMANSSYELSHRGGGARNGGSESTDSSSGNVADAEHLRELQSQGRIGNIRRWFSDQGLWPAKPNQIQHSWEEPRTIAARPLDDPPSPRLEGTTGEGLQQFSKGLTSTDRRNERGEVESGLGRTTNGASVWMDPNKNRVDRLRLLGNGVIPETAARAFSILYDRLENDESLNVFF